MIQTLKELTQKNKTVVFVSHSLSFLDMCDQIIVIGKGGKLCFSGTPNEVKNFFNDTDYINIYGKIQEDSEKWRKKFEKINDNSAGTFSNKKVKIKKVKRNIVYQLKILIMRYLKLLLSDKRNLILLFYRHLFLLLQ